MQLRAERRNLPFNGAGRSEDTQWEVTDQTGQCGKDMIYVLLIHGTFPGKAPWTRAGSSMGRAIASTVAGKGIVRAFDWTGRNSFAARDVAAERLREELARIISGDEAARIYIIAHSHGGNVALQALRDSSVVVHVRGLVCLATPVFHVVEVSQSKPENLMSWFAATVTAIVLYLWGVARFTLFLLGNPDVLTPDQRPFGWTAFAGIAVLPLALAIAFAIRYGRSVADRVDSFLRVRLELVLNAARVPELPSARAIFVRHSGDEASALGGTVHLAAWASGLVSSAANVAIGALDYFWERRVFSFWSLVAVILMPFAFEFALGREVGKVVPLIVLGVAVVAAAAILSINVVLFLLRAFSTLAQSLFFGPEILSTVGSVRVSVESAPPGRWQIVTPQVNSGSASADEPFPYAHGRVYQHPQFIAVIVDWIVASMAADQESLDV